tara:strand:+ start:1253 stop:1630 length:378 start_codon:yes stop_codon:yes gene_type:complete
MFDHVQVRVRDLQASRDFYAPVMAVLGHGVVLEVEEVVIGYGPDPHDMFEIRQSGPDSPLSASAHVAFVAKDEATVNEFHRVAVQHGGTCNGKPGLRPHYEEGYYAAFVLDPDGHNIEAVCSLPT